MCFSGSFTELKAKSDAESAEDKARAEEAKARAAEEKAKVRTTGIISIIFAAC